MWVCSALLALLLAFFVFNFANTVRWQIRAQNAADSAAAALLAKDAQSANSLTMLMYALDLQDFKLSTINNTLTSLLQNNTVCLLSVPCSANITTLISKYTNYVSESALIVQNISTFASQLPNSTIQDQLGLLTYPAGSSRNAHATNLLQALFPTSGSGAACVQVSTDCGFNYSVAVVTAVPLVVDVVACRKVPTLVSQFMHAGSGTFTVVGRSTVELAPLNSTKNVGSLVSALGNPNIHEAIPLNVNASVINLANLNLTTGMLVPSPVSPLTAANVPC
jgi:hypothetical protein